MIHVVETADTVLIRIINAVPHKPIALVIMDDNQRGEFASNHSLLDNRYKPGRKGRSFIEFTLAHLNLKSARQSTIWKTSHYFPKIEIRKVVLIDTVAYTTQKSSITRIPRATR